MSWLNGLTRNWAHIEPGAHDPTLEAVVLAIPKEPAVDRIRAAIARQPRWAVIEADRATGTIHATHATRIWRFVDDVRIRIEPWGDGSRLTAESRSRVGKGDLGQNARNLRELVRVLRSEPGLGREA
jgi:uncharacterized protein (DUF1499 family)